MAGEQHVDAVVDATHPFAETITANAAQAGAATGVPVVVLRRPGWQPGTGDNWHPVDSLAEAADALPGIGRRVLLTTGRLGLAAFAHLAQLHFVVRSVEPPEPPMPRTSKCCSRAGRSPWPTRRRCCASTGSTWS